MTRTRRAASLLLLRDLATAAALLWMTLSDGWPPIAVTAGLVLSRVLVVPRLSSLSGSRKVHGSPSSG